MSYGWDGDWEMRWHEECDGMRLTPGWGREDAAGWGWGSPGEVGLVNFQGRGALGRNSLSTGTGARDARRALGGTGRAGLCARAGHWEGQGKGEGTGRGLRGRPIPGGCNRRQEEEGGIYSPVPTSLSSLAVPRLEDETQKREDAEKSLVLFRKVRGLAGLYPHPPPNPHPQHPGVFPIPSALPCSSSRTLPQDVDHATLSRLELERKVELLMDEIGFLKKLHEEVGPGWDGEQVRSLRHGVMLTLPRRSCGTWK